MSAAPEFMVSGLPRSQPVEESPRPNPAGEESRQALWGWISVGVLAICWLAEGALCAARGY